MQVSCLDSEHLAICITRKWVVIGIRMSPSCYQPRLVTVVSNAPEKQSAVQRSGLSSLCE
jgi:hypothetical protein